MHSRPKACKNPILREILGAAPGIGGKPNVQPKFSERFLKIEWLLRTRTSLTKQRRPRLCTTISNLPAKQHSFSDNHPPTTSCQCEQPITSRLNITQLHTMKRGPRLSIQEPVLHRGVTKEGFIRSLGDPLQEKYNYLPPLPSEQEKIIFREELWLHPPLQYICRCGKNPAQQRATTVEIDTLFSPIWVESSIAVEDRGLYHVLLRACFKGF